MKNQQYYMPAVLICGIIAGLLSGVPCVNLLMCCFCIQIVLPGMFAVKFVALMTPGASFGEVRRR